MTPRPHPPGSRSEGEPCGQKPSPSSLGVLIILGSVSSAIYVSFLLTTRGTPAVLASFTFRKGIVSPFLIHFFLLFALYLAAVRSTSREATSRRAVAITVLAFAVAFRAILLWAQPVLSDDIYRYVWDGKVQAAGVNPYLYAPDATELSHLRDDMIHPRINRSWARTIYPPGAQWLFRAIYSAKPDSVFFLKVTLVAFDILAMLLLIRLLRALSLSPERAILYAWHPLALFEIAGSGHLDGLLLPFLVGGLLFWERHRDRWAGAALGVAAAVKLYPALLIPALVRRRGPRLLLPAVTVVGLLYLTYVATAGRMVLGFLPQYLSDPGERFNSGPGGVLAYALGSLSSTPSQVAYGVLVLALLVVGVRGTRTGERGLDAAVAEVLLVFGTFITFAQTIHPWYLLWILPLLAVRPSPAWLYLSGAIAISYVKYTSETLHMPLWAGLLEYLPFYLLGLLGTRTGMLQRVRRGLIGQSAKGRTL